MGQTPIRKKILYLVHRVPYPPDKGDRIRAYHQARFLSRHADLYLGSPADEPVSESAKAQLETFCQQVSISPLTRTRWAFALGSLLQGKSISEGAFYSRTMARMIRQWAIEKPFDAILLSASSLVPYVRQPIFRKTPIVVDLVDVDSQKWLDYSQSTSFPKSWLYSWEGHRLRALEKGLPAWVRAITLVSDPESDIYRSFAPPGPVHTVYNGVDLDYFSPQPDTHPEPNTCVFVGAMDYLPNVDGAIRLAQEIWPKVRQQYPKAQFHIVGRKPTAAVRQLEQIPGIKVTADVPDVRPYVARASAVVIPLRIARGLQNKVLEAMAMARPVVAASPALAALKTQSGRHLLQVNEDKDWLPALQTVFDNLKVAKELGNQVRAYVEENHNWATCLEPLLPLLGLACPSSPSQVPLSVSPLAPHA